MCCRTTITPYVPEVAEAILRIGRFELMPAQFWARTVEEESAMVKAFQSGDALRLEIWPAIQNPEHHVGKRIAGSIYFEIAAKYAEKVGGRIVQLSNITGCIEDGSEHLLAHYPDSPMLWEKVCPGFRAVLLAVPEGEPPP